MVPGSSDQGIGWDGMEWKMEWNGRQILGWKMENFNDGKDGRFG